MRWFFSRSWVSLYSSLLIMNDLTSAQILLTSPEQVNTGVSFGGSQIDTSVVDLVQTQDLWQFSSLVSSHQIGEFLPVFAEFDDATILGFWLLGLIWVLTIFWVLRDAMARSDSWVYQLFSTLLVTVLSPIVGLPLYLAFRPLVYKWERGYWREAMTRGVVVCPHCRSLVDEQYKACVFCGENLRTACKECEAQFYRGYGYCPECWAPNISE